MLAMTRKSKIRSIVNEKKSVTVTELSKKFSVTDETIRRDLKSLEEEGVLTRTYGGAFIQDGVINDISVSVREDILVPNKKAIARQCAMLINNGDTISLDVSTTAFHICEEIKHKRVTVLTNSLNIINFLKDYDNIKLISAGGTVYGDKRYFAGDMTVRNIEGYYVDKAFISCRSIDMSKGLTESGEELSVIRRIMIERADKVFLIADHTKFDRISFINICFFDKVHTVVTDEAMSEKWKEFFESRNIKLFDCVSMRENATLAL